MIRSVTPEGEKMKTALDDHGFHLGKKSRGQEDSWEEGATIKA